MSRFVVFVVLAAYAAFFVPASMAHVRAASSQGVVFLADQNTQRDNPVESQTDAYTPAEHSACPGGLAWWPCDDTYWPRADGQSAGATWVVNPTGCAWDPDDHNGWISTGGTIPSGGSASSELCMVAEQNSYYRMIYDMAAWWDVQPKSVQADVVSASSLLSVSVCYMPQSRCFALMPVSRPDLHGWEYRACISLIYDVGDPALGVIPDSQGGLGLVTVATLRIANPGVHGAKVASAQFDQVGYGGTCTPSPSVWSYPFTRSP